MDLSEQKIEHSDLLSESIVFNATEKSFRYGKNVVEHSLSLFSKGFPFLKQTVTKGVSGMFKAVNNINETCNKLKKIHSALEELENCKKKNHKAKDKRRNREETKKLSIKQSNLLLKWWNENTPTLEEKKKIATELDLSVRQVTNWIYHRKHRPKSEFRLSPEKHLFLLEYFAKCTSPSHSEVKLLSDEINIPISKIKRWFYRKRHCEKMQRNIT